MARTRLTFLPENAIEVPEADIWFGALIRHDPVTHFLEELTQEVKATPLETAHGIQPPKPHLKAAQLSQARREERLADYQYVVALRTLGFSQTAIAAQVGVAHSTVSCWLSDGVFPEQKPHRRKMELDSHLSYLSARWEAGCHNIAQLYRELVARGYTHSYWSVYEGLEDGRIDRSALREVLWRYAPRPMQGYHLWIGIDVSGIARPFSRTAADHTALMVHNLPKGTKAITYGWHFSTMVILNEQPSSQNFILDQQRVKSDTTAIQVAVAQIKQIAGQVPAGSIVVLDRGYDATWL